MVGPNAGLCSRLKQKLPHIVTVKDFSHLYHTIFKKALKAFPQPIIAMIRDISSHFSYITQKSALLEEIQPTNNFQKLRVLSFVETRWLSMRETVNRILEIWPSLKVYFDKHGDKTQKTYFTLENETYLRVLYVLINEINSYNVYFQRENLYYNDILEKIEESFIVLFNTIAISEKRNLDFDSLFKLPFEELKNKDILDSKTDLFYHQLIKNNSLFEEEYLAQYDIIKELLPKNDQKKEEDIINAAGKFIIIALKYMKLKLPYRDETWENIKVIFLNEFDKNKCLSLKGQFSNIIHIDEMKENFVHELARLESNFRKIQYQNMVIKLSPLTLWNSLRKDYPTLFELLCALIVLPYSSVSVERVFSS